MKRPRARWPLSILTTWLTVHPLYGCGTRGDLSLGLLQDGDADTTSGSGTGDVRSTGMTLDAASTESPAAETNAPDARATGSSASSDSTLTTCEPPPLPSERFDFGGTGTEVIDRMGGASGELRGGATFTDDGYVELDGDDDYVDLPNGLLSSKTSATIVVWTSLVDGPAYWRLLDFGTSSEGEDPIGAAVGTTYVAITTETGLDPSGLALLIGHGGASSEDRALTDLNLDAPEVALGVVLDGETQQATLYVDGVNVASSSMTAPLSELEDVNNWLGRSQYAADPHYPGRYTELRVYATALSDCAVAAVTALGPDVLQ